MNEHLFGAVQKGDTLYLPQGTYTQEQVAKLKERFPTAKSWVCSTSQPTFFPYRRLRSVGDLAWHYADQSTGP